MSPRSVLITGGSRGLGAGLVQHFLHLGDAVATCSRSTTEQAETWAADPALEGRFLHRSVNVTDRDEVNAFVAEVVERFGGVDVLVNNAGVARDDVLGLVKDVDVDDVIDLNLKATIQITKT